MKSLVLATILVLFASGCASSNYAQSGGVASTTRIVNTEGTTVARVQNGRILSTDGSTQAYIRGSSIYSTSGVRIANIRAR